MKFTIFDEISAPEKSQNSLSSVKQAFGFIPNAIGLLSQSPAALEAYFSLEKLVNSTSFSPQEIQIAILSVSRQNECHYCVAAHSGQAKMAEVDDDDIQALRKGGVPSDSKLAALATFSQKMVSKQGWVEDDDLQNFLDAGYTRENIFDLVLIVAMKTITNYSNHFSSISLDDEFSEFAWQK